MCEHAIERRPTCELSAGLPREASERGGEMGRRSKARGGARPTEQPVSTQTLDLDARLLVQSAGAEHCHHVPALTEREGVRTNEVPRRIGGMGGVRSGDDRDAHAAANQIRSVFVRLRRRRAASEAFFRRFTEGFM